jgi:ATP-binding cassette subfamily B protein
VAWPLSIKGIIDLLGSHQQTYAQKRHLLNLFGVAIVVLVIGKQVLDSIASYQANALNSKVTFRLRKRLFDRLVNLPLGELGEMKSGGIVSRLSWDVESASGLIQQALIGPTVAAIRILLILGVLCFLSWRLAVAAVIILPPIGLMSVFWLRRVRPVFRSILADRAEVDSQVTEAFGGIRVVRAFRREPREGRAHAVGHHTIIRKTLFAQRMELVLGFAWGLLMPAALLTTLWYGGILCLRGVIRIGDIVAFNVYVAQLLGPLGAIITSIGQTQKSLAALERVFDVLAMKADKPDRPGALDAPAVVREVRLESVSFEHRPGIPVLHDISLTVPGGSVVALVGPSGAGKTTLTDLVARFHDPTSGRVLLNGVDVRDIRLASFRSLLAVVQQEIFLFDGTVRQNIAYGRRDAIDHEITNAACRANADEFIRQLPQGYDTIIGERGLKLSGGQRQRLSIARALLADPQILILDEATSNLDTESEQLIQAALNELLQDRTTFIIAHRLSTVTHADLIVAMDRGRIFEMGSHDELMDRGGMYFEMVQRQRESFEWGRGEGISVGKV